MLNAIVQIYTRAGCAPDEPGFFEDFKPVRVKSKEAALRELAFTRSCNSSEHFRLKLEDWNTGTTEIIE